MFSGNFDGKGHMISNLTIGTASTPAEGDVFGLFGAADGKISNVNLNHVSINGVAKRVSGYAIGLTGGLAGSASGGIENCHVTDLSINMTTPENGNAAAYWIGGLVGAFDGTQGIKECSVSGNINEASGKGSIGGLIGELGEASEISYSRADVSLDVEANARGGADVGGFIGKGNGNKNEETVIKNCYATGNVTGGSYIGGFAGSLWGLNIKNCYATGNVTQAVASMASFVGTDASAGYGYGSVKNCYSTGSVIGTVAYRYAFAMQDATERSEITNCYFADGNLEVKNAHEAAVAKSLTEMKTEDFTAALNADDKNNGWTFVEGRTPICGAEPADYSAVDAALESIPSDLTVYTDESVEGLNVATTSVVRGRVIARQAEVDEMAKAIEEAIAALEYKDADYSKVEEAIEKANGLNKEDYKDFIELWIHEIKIPIATSKMIVENNKNEITASINEELDKIDNYTEQALFYARSNTVEKDYIVRKIQLKEIVNASILKNKAQLIQNKISIDTKNLDETVCTDSKWCIFIINQIIQNSIKYSKNADRQIEIYGERKKENIILYIKDNGIGIKESEITRVFEKGFTGENGRITGKKSTGIGLYLCKKLCDKLCIGLELNSKKDEGTEVKLIFPNNSFINMK